MIRNAKVIGPNISYETYKRQQDGVTRGHKDYSLSRSSLAEILVNPAKWRDGLDDDDSTDATKWGSLLDVMAMTPERFDECYAVRPATYNSKGMQCPTCKTITDAKTCRTCKCDRVEVTVEKEWNNLASECQEWVEKQGSREIVGSKVLEKAKQAVAKLEADADIPELFRCSQKQVMVIGEWVDKATGVVVPVRCLIDLVPDVKHERFRKALGDFKTARNGNPDFWDRVVDDGAYDIQAALSMGIYTLATGEDRVDWLFPIQENIHPYHVVKPMPALTAEFLAYGRSKYEAALKIYSQCIATGVWPSYSTRDRLVMDPVQLIGPDSLFSYRQQAGLGTRMSDFAPAPMSEPPKDETDIPH